MSDKPDPSWSAEKMAAYLKEKYGDQPRFHDAHTGPPVTNEELVKLFEGRRK
jgi:hypothetical protein